MSHKKNKEEAVRWLTTGQDELETAIILRKNKKHAHACFHAQQAVEKAVKRRNPPFPFGSTDRGRFPQLEGS
ncbi:MAG TPA: HEPN domain-containing protein [Candidatus Deferrimicrobium sp.]|nr:HEPN domain-containing protein [Candidatus Deferrimicrobium sp.]